MSNFWGAYQSTRTYESVYVVLTEVFTRKCACVLRPPNGIKKAELL